MANTCKVWRVGYLGTVPMPVLLCACDSKSTAIMAAEAFSEKTQYDHYFGLSVHNKVGQFRSQLHNHCPKCNAEITFSDVMLAGTGYENYTCGCGATLEMLNSFDGSTLKETDSK